MRFLVDTLREPDWTESSMEDHRLSPTSAFMVVSISAGANKTRAVKQLLDFTAVVSGPACDAPPAPPRPAVPCSWV